MLDLKRPLVTIDLETTGLDRENDRIIQIALLKDNGDPFKRQVFNQYLNPGIPIPETATAIHGITNEMVKDAPTFAELAGQIFEFIVGCDFLGFNSNWFDIPLLANEFSRVGIQLDPKAFNMIDAGNLYKIQEPRDLTNAIKTYVPVQECNFGTAHDALADAKATLAVFKYQLQRYPELPQTVEELALFTNYNCKVADLSGKFVYNDNGELLLNFGKHKGQLARLNLSFVHWMYFKGTFAADTIAVCEDLLGITASKTSSDDDDDFPF